MHGTGASFYREINSVCTAHHEAWSVPDAWRGCPVQSCGAPLARWKRPRA